MNNEKTNYSVARVETYTKVSIIKAERHNERKNSSYANMNVDLTQTPNNVHYKRCETTYNERLKELVNNGQVSLRGLKDNAKIYDDFLLLHYSNPSNLFFISSGEGNKFFICSGNVSLI